jgi:hypothetical protein
LAEGEEGTEVISLQEKLLEVLMCLKKVKDTKNIQNQNIKDIKDLKGEIKCERSQPASASLPC